MKKNEEMRSLQELLKIFIDEGMITFDDVMAGTEAVVNKLLKKLHTEKIIPKDENKKYSYWRTNVGKGKKRKPLTANSKEELEQKLLEYYADEIREAKDTEHTLACVYKEYLDYKKQFVKVENKKKAISPTTIARYERDFEKHFKDTELFKTPISSIKATELELFFLNIAKSGAKEKCLKNLMGYVSKVYEYARRQKYISENIYLDIDKNIILAHTEGTTYKAEERILTNSQFRELYEAVREHLSKYPNYAPDYAVLLAMQTGMRVGEIVALKWEDVREGKIFIDRMERRLDTFGEKSKLTIDEPKCLKHRDIPLTTEIKAILNEIRANCEYSEFIFTYEGKRCTERSVSACCSRRGNEAGLSKCSIHQIRRTVSSEMQKYVSRAMVCELLGHTEETNKAHYTYDTSDFAEKEKVFSQFFSNILNFEEYKKFVKAL